MVYAWLPAAYNAMDWLSVGAWWRLVRRALEHVPAGGRVLEVGFGPGRLHAELARRADECLGLDLAWGMCRFTQRRLRKEGLASRITRGSVFALPYPDDCIGTVVSTFAFSGFGDGQRAMDEVTRVTAPGGRIVVVDIGLPEDGNRLGVSLAQLWQQVGDFLYDLPGMMRAAGLDVSLCQEYGPGRHIRIVIGNKPGGSGLSQS